MTTGTRKSAMAARARVLLVGDRFLLLEALRHAIDSPGTDVALTPIDRGDIQSAVSGFSPHIIVFDATQVPESYVVLSFRSDTGPARCCSYPRAGRFFTMPGAWACRIERCV